MDAGRQSTGLRHDALDWLALATAPGLGPRGALDLVERLGSPRAAFETSVHDRGRAAETVDGALARAEGEARALAAAGASLVVWTDPDYPRWLREIHDPPLTLAIRGDLCQADELAVSIVGTRHASEYGRRVATELARDLTQMGFTVVSGLAAGIDGAAHRAAIAGGGRTVAVLGTGIDVVYPSWHAELARAIAAQGALVSELPCGAPPLQHHFPRRNRIISGLSVATVVVEATEDSGSLITANSALEQQRDVYAVPGPLGDARQRGTHRLIQQGAKLLTGARDILEDLNPALRARLVARRSAAVEATLTPPERRILEALGLDGRHVDDVIRTAAESPGSVLETLLALELRGLVRQLPGKRFCRLAA